MQTEELFKRIKKVIIMDKKRKIRFLLACIGIILIAIISKEAKNIKFFVRDRSHSGTSSEVSIQECPSDIPYEKLELPD